MKKNKNKNDCLFYLVFIFQCKAMYLSDTKAWFHFWDNSARHACCFCVFRWSSVNWRFVRFTSGHGKELSKQLVSRSQCKGTTFLKRTTEVRVKDSSFHIQIIEQPCCKFCWILHISGSVFEECHSEVATRVAPVQCPVLERVIQACRCYTIFYRKF